MQIFLMVIQLLSYLAPAVAKVLASINESKDGGIKGYDKLVGIALDQVKAVALEAGTPSTMPGGDETGWEKNMRLYMSAVYKTADAAKQAGETVKDHQVMQAVSDAYTAWKMTAKENSGMEPISLPPG